MTERIIPASQQAMYDNFHFAPGIRTGDLLIMSGQVGMDASGKCPDDLTEQFRLAFENIGEIFDFLIEHFFSDFRFLDIN